MKLFTVYLILTLGLNLYSGEGENSVLFNGKSTLKGRISASEKIGSVLFESELSDSPAPKYNIVLIHGEMPDANVRIELRIQQKFYLWTSYKKYEPVYLKRFDNGRFWAKFKLDNESQQPFKIAVINSGIRFDHIFVIYETEIFIESGLKEEKEPSFKKPGARDVEHPDALIPTIVTREQWNASAPTQDYIPHAPKMFTVHHTVGKYPASLQESIAEVQFIQDYHQNARGWIDIGYHFLIDPNGNIFQGRPVDVVGAHVQGKNTTNVGIAIMGNYHPPEADEINAKSVDSFVNLGKYISQKYTVDVSSFYAHKDLNATACPGDDLYKLMPELKKFIFEENLPARQPPAALPENFPDTENLSLKQLQHVGQGFSPALY